MSGLSKSFSLLIILILAVSSLIMVKPAFAQSIPTPTVPQEEHFIVQQTFWAFGGTYTIGSFSANSGDYIVFNISSVNVDPDRPDDIYIVELGIVSAKHGTTYVSDTKFSQTIPLNYTDYYTITADKHPFQSSVRISGEFTVYHNPVLLVTDSPSATLSPTPSPTLTPAPTPTLIPPSDRTISLLSTEDVIAIVILAVAVISVLLYRRHRR